MTLMTLPEALVVVRIAGGWDALNVVIPHGDDDYHRLRPTLALGPEEVLRLDGFFGLHPALHRLLPLFREGQAAALHATGLIDTAEHSHFLAWDHVDSGGDGQTYPAGGWLARLLGPAPPKVPGGLRAVAFGDGPCRLLSGLTSSAAVSSVEELSLPGTTEQKNAFMKTLEAFLGLSSLSVAQSVQRSMSTVRSIDRVRERLLQPSRHDFPQSDFGRRLRELSELFRCGAGLEAGVVTLGGFDTHVLQGSRTGPLARLLEEVARGLSAFARAMAESWKRTVVLVISEFGRRVAENGGGGTDHGHGGVMLLLGGSLGAGQVLGTWPSLSRGALEGPGDLRVTTDIRAGIASALGLEETEISPRVG